MAKKQQQLEAKLGSWTEQASLTRSLGTDQPARQEHLVPRSLMDRIVDTAQAAGLSQNELVGYLLTWALDQVEAGHHTIPPDVHR